MINAFLSSCLQSDLDGYDLAPKKKKMKFPYYLVFDKISFFLGVWFLLISNYFLFYIF